MVPRSVTGRTFLLQFGSSLGTCFAMDHDGRQYIITAKHVIAPLADGDDIALGYKGGWLQGRAALIGHGPGTIDISVIALEKPIAGGANLPPSERIFYAQDVYFLGFPFGLFMDAGEINNHFPIPLVKKAIFSGSMQIGDVNVLLLDGINNKGFSGGPVVIGRLGASETFRVMSVVSGYETSDAAVYLDERETPLTVQENTGIIVSYSIQHALDLIKQNPQGAPL